MTPRFEVTRQDGSTEVTESTDFVGTSLVTVTASMSAALLMGALMAWQTFTLTASAPGYVDVTLTDSFEVSDASLFFEFDATSLDSIQDFNTPSYRYTSTTAGTGDRQLLTGLTTPYGGTKAIEAWFDSVASCSGGNQYLTHRWEPIPNSDSIQPTEVWIETWVQFRGYSIQDCGANEQKWQLLYHNTATRHDNMIKLGGSLGDRGIMIWNSDQAYGGVAANEHCASEFRYVTASEPCPAGQVNMLPFDTLAFIENDSAWIAIRLHVRMETSNGAADGAMHGWICDAAQVCTNYMYADSIGFGYDPAGKYFQRLRVGADPRNIPAQSHMSFLLGRIRMWHGSTPPDATWNLVPES